MNCYFRLGFSTLFAAVLLAAPVRAQLEPRASLKGHKHTITCVAYSGDGRLLRGMRDPPAARKGALP